VWRNLGCTRARSKSPVSSASAATKQHHQRAATREEGGIRGGEVRDLGTPWSAQWGPRTRRPSRSCGNRGLVRRRRPSPAAFEGAEPWRLGSAGVRRRGFCLLPDEFLKSRNALKIETAPRRRILARTRPMDGYNAVIGPELRGL